MLNNSRNFFNYHRFKEFTNTKDSLGNIDSMILRYTESIIDFAGYNKKYGGNIVKLDRDEKDKMKELLKIEDHNINKTLTKLCKAGILYKIRNGVYQYNPYLAGKGNDDDIEWLRRYGIFRNHNQIQYQNGDTVFVDDVFKTKDELLEVFIEDYKKEKENEKETVHTQNNLPMFATKVLDMYIDFKIITDDEKELLKKQQHPLQLKPDPLEKINNLLTKKEGE